MGLSRDVESALLSGRV